MDDPDRAAYRRHPDRDAKENRFWQNWLKQMGRFSHLMDLTENSGDSQQATTIGAWKKDFQVMMQQWEELSGHKLVKEKPDERNDAIDVTEYAEQSRNVGSEEPHAVLGLGEDKPEAWRGPYADSPEARAEGSEDGLPER